MVHRRRETKGLSTDQVKELHGAWQHAPWMRRPLNTLLSLRPLSIDAISPADRCTLFASFRNKLGVYARAHGFTPAFVWSREVNLDGSGEHMHVLMHVPIRHRSRFEDTVIGWYPGPGEIDVTTASQRTRITYNGKRLSAIGYITKQMTPQAWYKRGLIRKAGGPILGKRGGVTNNLDWRAQAAIRAARRRPLGTPQVSHDTIPPATAVEAIPRSVA